MKKVLLLSASVLLVSCGGGGGSAASCDKDYWDGTVGTCIPGGWDLVNRETLRQRGVPEETIVGFQHAEPVSGQFPTVAVTQEKLAAPVDPKEYSMASIRSVEVLNGYEHVDTKEFTVDDATVNLHVFTGQPIEGEPRRRFYQVSTAVGDTGYTMTAVTPVSIDASLEKQIMLMLEHFTLVAPKEEE